MKKLESGRSMVEMLGVLAIIGVLSIGGIAGYVLSMNRYRANQAMDIAAKYASVLYSSYQTSNAMGEVSNWKATAFQNAKLGNAPTDTGFEYTQPNNTDLSNGTVKISVTFPSADICKTAAKINGDTPSCSTTGCDSTVTKEGANCMTFTFNQN